MTRMGRTLLFLLIAAAVVVIAVLAFSYYKDKGLTDNGVVPDQTSIVGCYVANIGNDVYTLTIQSQEESEVLGTLSYRNFQKDSSVGTLSGTYADGIILGEYSFNSEGTHSFRQVIFKRVGGDFVQGFGPVEVVGDREELIDPTLAVFDPNVTFVAQDSCHDFEPEIIQSVVLYFGSQLKMVSVLGPKATTTQAIEKYYKPYITQALLNEWKSDPTSAPGRIVSSPYPQRIIINSMQQARPDLYSVLGTVVEVTTEDEIKGEITSQYDVAIELTRVEGHWLISDFRESRP